MTPMTPTNPRVDAAEAAEAAEPVYAERAARPRARSLAGGMGKPTESRLAPPTHTEPTTPAPARPADPPSPSRASTAPTLRHTPTRASSPSRPRAGSSAPDGGLGSPARSPQPPSPQAQGAGGEGAPSIIDRTSGRDPAEPVDFEAVAVVRRAVTEAFRAGQSGLSAARTFDADAHGDTIRELAEEQVRDWAVGRTHEGHPAPTPAQRQGLIQAICDSIFGAGPFQAYLDLPGIENVDVDGHDRVRLSFADGRTEWGQPVAASDDDLIGLIAHMGSMCLTGEKDFSPATKHLRMTLPDGSRFAAEAWATYRPSVSIRKHRYIDIDLEGYRQLGAITHGMQALLHCAVRAGLNIVISGPPAAGKTTMARALLAALDPSTSVATIESQYELLLHRMPDRHERVWAAEACEGGETTRDGRVLGAYDLTDLTALALQKNLDRLIIGEVTGNEVLALLRAMQASNGGVTTVHARSAEDTINRLATLVLGASGNVTTQYARSLVADNVDLVVHLAAVDETPLGGRKHRFVDDVVAVRGGGENGVEFTPLWTPGRDGRGEPTGHMPPYLLDLMCHGFDPVWGERDPWDQSIDLLLPPTAVHTAAIRNGGTQ